MNPDVKAQWVAALRSGNYEQTTGVLKSTQGQYCCLGVLCDLAVQAGVVKLSEYHDDEVEGEPVLHGYGYGPTDDFNDPGTTTGELPEEVVKWAGLTWTNPDVNYHDGSVSLITANDSEGFSFNEIADAIEASL